jgi:hypothetical protein
MTDSSVNASWVLGDAATCSGLAGSFVSAACAGFVGAAEPGPLLGAVAQAPNNKVKLKQLTVRKRLPENSENGQKAFLWVTQAFFKIRFSRCEAQQSS